MYNAFLHLCLLIALHYGRIRVPVVKGPQMHLLRQNYYNEQMEKTHDCKIIGHITCTVRLDPGLVSNVCPQKNFSANIM